MSRCIFCGLVELSSGDVDGFCSSCRYNAFISNNEQSVPLGWKCVRCGVIHAPWVDRCNCKPNFNITTTNKTFSE